MRRRDRSINHKVAHARAQVWMRGQLREMFQHLNDSISGVLLRYADSTGHIPARQHTHVKRDTSQAAQSYFVGSDGRSPFASDGVTALAPFPQILNEAYVRVVYDVVSVHHRWLKSHLPEDIFSWLSGITRRLQLSEQTNAVPEDYPIFRPNPLAELDPNRQWVPMHKWTDSNGYQLSDRIWRAGEETRKKIDAIISKGLAEGKSAMQIAKAVEAYLVPTRTGIRTLKPYGIRFMPDGASFDAMRLARTEIARAANQAAFISAYLNPYVDGIDVRRSANGDANCKICPQHATIDMSGNRVRPPYSTSAAVIPPFHPHDMCLIAGVVTDTPETVTANLRRFMEEPNRTPIPYTTAIKKDEFVGQLLGPELAGLLSKTVQRSLL